MKGICWFRTGIVPTSCTYITPNKLYMNSQWDDTNPHRGDFIDDSGEEIEVSIKSSEYLNGGSWEVLYPADL